MTKKSKIKVALFIGIPFLGIGIFILWFNIATRITPPIIENRSALEWKRKQTGDNFFSIGKNKLQKSESGLWEMYVEGNGFERGAAFGKLTKELIYEQEKAFIDQIKILVPNESYLKSLKYLLAFFNRGMDNYIPEEYLNEIYGISFSHPDTFDFVGEKYNRVLNYHAAHDIGHAMRQYMLVGCTSFSVNGNLSEDSSMIIGRNFDFYVGDDFAKNKIVAFFNPDSGHKFMTITWPGFIGAVSGMNEHGLTVTLNAAASAPPTSTKTPIALLAREILQYASTIDEAYAIAQQRETFVSETIMIGSAKDNKTALIEKSPKKTALFYSETEKTICSNHYQSAAFAEDNMNLENIRTSDSPYRFQRTEELIFLSEKLNPKKTAAILRNQKGTGETELGYGNQKSINQLIAHHSVIFKPSERKVWVSSSPYQLGEFICYDLRKIFAEFPELTEKTRISTDEENIPADPFLHASAYRGYEHFRKLKNYIQWFTAHAEFELPEHVLTAFEGSNPKFYHTHEVLGNYHKAHKNYQVAKRYYNNALALEIATLTEKENIEKQRDYCRKKVK